MEIRFEGAEAEAHEIEAYSGAVSLEGISRAATLAAHYAVTEDVRFRAPYSNDLEFRIFAPEPGSLRFPLKAVANIAAAADKRKLAAALFLALLARSTGQEADPDVAAEISSVPSGDLDALAEAAAPGLQRAHRWIDRNSKKIVVSDVQEGSVTLDTETKDYLQIEDTGDVMSQDVTVSALNANNRTGRVYFEDLGRTIPFKVGREATPRTLSNLSKYLNRYVDKTNEWVSIKYLPIKFADGRMKRIVIFDCALASELE